MNNTPTRTDTLMVHHFKLDEIRRNAVETARLAMLDIHYRIDKGIYATPQDKTAAEVWEDLKVAQESPNWMFGTFSQLAELQSRGQIEGI